VRRRSVFVIRRSWRGRLLHSPWVRPLAAAVLAAVLAVTVGREVAAARADQRRWGTARDLVVATRHLDAGDVVTGSAVARASWPLGLVPEDALDQLPVGRTVTAAIEAGEPLVTSRLAPEGVSGLAARLPPGWRAVAVPVGPARLPLTPRDTIDLLATFTSQADATGATGAGGASGTAAPTFPVATSAQVIEVGERSITVGVREADAARVVFAVAVGVVTPVLRAPG
jgi:Flp pilus assembly protein CpaB